MIQLPKGLFGFQEDCVRYLLDTVSREDSRQTITVKAPTGAGKTVILIDFVDKYLDLVQPETAVIWLCPGKGDLEEQSRQKMCRLLPDKRALVLHDVLTTGFPAGSTTFINWELVTKKGNRALSDGERKNLFDRIAEGHRRGMQYLIIIDEEHSNDTKKASDLLQAFAAKNIIRVSATARQQPLAEYYEVDEMAVIESGLITRALYINEDVDYHGDFESEHGYLIALADRKRQAIAAAYAAMPGRTGRIRPLCIIQFPNASDRLIRAVEETLAGMGYTYENRMVARWMSDASEKRNLEGITEPDATPVFLLMKQAIATGWDCPRAKILVKLRERMSENFEIQTIGRLRRMPEARHYGTDLLDCCYLYTFDDKYKESIKLSLNQAFEVQRVFLRDACRGFTLEKQLRNRDADGLGERETFQAVLSYFTEKYGLTGGPGSNRQRLEAAGYRFQEALLGRQLEGRFLTMEALRTAAETRYRSTERQISTHSNGLDLLHAIDSIKSAVGMTAQKTRVVLERLFRARVGSPKKLLSLDTLAYYAFVINNEKRLREDFRGASAVLVRQLSLLEPKTAVFTIPEQELCRYDPAEPDPEPLETNAYRGYSTAMVVEGIRSKCERLFEHYCEDHRDRIAWVYKNGDKGLQYFSIVYVDAFGHQWLFYPDYLVRTRDGEIWILETKGGESRGVSKNIDPQVENKFAAFREYAEKKHLKWGFIRDRNERLRINNTCYSDSLSTPDWRPIREVFPGPAL